KKINIVIEQISLMWQDLLDKLDENARPKNNTEENKKSKNNTEVNEEVYVPNIVLEDDPFCKGDKTAKRKIFKKYYKDLGIFVACRGVESIEEKQKEFP